MDPVRDVLTCSPNTTIRHAASEMSKRKLRYEDLSELLAAHGTKQSSANLRNKINRGILGADLFIQLLLVMDVQQINKANLQEILASLET